MSAFEAGVLATITGAECHIEAYTPPKTTAAVPFTSTAAHAMSVHRRASSFLVLSPTLSSDYPTQFSSRSSSVNSTTEKPVLTAALSGSAIDMSTAAEATEQTKKDRRSSSTGSGFGTFKRRFLKLGPVFNGGEPGVSDYVDIEEE